MKRSDNPQQKPVRWVGTSKEDLSGFPEADRAAAQASERGLRAMGKKRDAEIAVTPGSGNVFADLGFAEPEEELTKA